VVCEEDVAEFVCSNRIDGIVNWHIILPDIRFADFSFGKFFTQPWTWNGPGSPVIRANVSFFNETLIVSTMTFYGAIYLNNTLLDCNGQRITYVINTSKGTTVDVMCE